MKKNKKLTATLLIFALLLITSIGSLSVFASEDDAAADAASTETAVVSGCDLKKDELVKVEVKQYGFSMLAPKGNLTTIESPAENFTAVGYSRPYFMEQGCAMQIFTDNENYCAVSLFVEELDSIYNYYGDYSSLSKEQQDELVSDSLSEGNESAEFVKINGRTYLEAYVTDNSEDTGDVYAQYQFTTVINGQKYMLYIQTVNAVESDNAVINEMIKSIKLNGMSGIESGGVSVTDIILIVVCVVLALAVALAYFFLFRVNEFTKAGIKEFAIVGFDLPAREDDDDDFDDDEEEDDEEDDDDDEESDEADEVDEDSDDERIIKD